MMSLSQQFERWPDALCLSLDPRASWSSLWLEPGKSSGSGSQQTRRQPQHHRSTKLLGRPWQSDPNTSKFRWEIWEVLALLAASLVLALDCSNVAFWWLSGSLIEPTGRSHQENQPASEAIQTWVWKNLGANLPVTIWVCLKMLDIGWYWILRYFEGILKVYQYIIGISDDLQKTSDWAPGRWVVCNVAVASGFARPQNLDLDFSCENVSSASTVSWLRRIAMRELKPQRIPIYLGYPKWAIQKYQKDPCHTESNWFI